MAEPHREGTPTTATMTRRWIGWVFVFLAFFVWPLYLFLLGTPGTAVPLFIAGAIAGVMAACISVNAMQRWAAILSVCFALAGGLREYGDGQRYERRQMDTIDRVKARLETSDIGAATIPFPEH